MSIGHLGQEKGVVPAHGGGERDPAVERVVIEQLRLSAGRPRTKGKWNERVSDFTMDIAVILQSRTKRSDRSAADTP